MSLEHQYEIAVESREEFKNGNVSDEQLTEFIDKHVPEHAEAWKTVLPLARSLFPKFNCGLATVYLREKNGPRRNHPRTL